MMADDMGFSDIGCYGSEISTPHIDSLAQKGVRFTQFYCNAKCCPTRAALLTGLYHHQAGMGDMSANLGVPSYQGYLNDRCVTIAEALREGGYTTLMSGKWHAGDTRPHWPRDRGFDKYFGLINGGSSYYRVTKGTTQAIDDEPYLPKDDSFYMTDAIGDNAVKFLEQYGRREKPFFLYTAFTSPHFPLHAFKEDIERYRGKYMVGWEEIRERRHARMLEMGIVDRRWPLSPRESRVPAWDSVENKRELDLKMAVYAAQIDRMDQNIGRILAKLKEVGAEDNTLVLFLADNGANASTHDTGVKGVPPGGPDSYLSYGRPWANASNTPFRFYKDSMFEGGISTPLVARWPSRIRQNGKLVHQPGHVMDVMSTCLEAAGVEYPKTYKGREVLPTEGRSLVPLFDGKRREPHANLFWEFADAGAVRQGNLKLVRGKPREWELYDLAADRTELKNLAGAFPGKVKELDGLYQEWMKRCGVFTREDLRKVRAKQAGNDPA